MPAMTPESLRMLNLAPAAIPGATTSEVMGSAFDYSFYTASRIGLEQHKWRNLQDEIRKFEESTGKNIPRTLSLEEQQKEEQKAAEEGRAPVISLEDRFYALAGEGAKARVDNAHKAGMQKLEREFVRDQENSGWMQRNIAGLASEMAGVVLGDPLTAASLLVQPELGLVRGAGLLSIGKAAGLVGAREAVLGAAFGGLQAGLVEEDLKRLNLMAPTAYEGAAFGALGGLTLGAAAGALGQTARLFVRRLETVRGARDEARINAFVDETIADVARGLDIPEGEARAHVVREADAFVAATRRGDEPPRPKAEPEPPVARELPDAIVRNEEVLRNVARAETPDVSAKVDAFVDALKRGDASEARKLFRALPEETQSALKTTEAIEQMKKTLEPEASRAKLEDALTDEEFVKSFVKEFLPFAQPESTTTMAMRVPESRRASFLAQRISALTNESEGQLLLNMKERAQAHAQARGQKKGPLSEEAARGEGGGKTRPRSSGDRQEPTSAESKAQGDYVKSELEREVAAGRGDEPVFFDGREISVERALEDIQATDGMIKKVRACVTGAEGSGSGAPDVSPARGPQAPARAPAGGFEIPETVSRGGKDYRVLQEPTGKFRKDKSPVHAFVKHDTQEIRIDSEALRANFADKPWTKPKVEGVEPIAADKFKTPDDWVRFVLEHEAAHTHIRPSQGESKGAYENRINKQALKVMFGEEK